MEGENLAIVIYNFELLVFQVPFLKTSPHRSGNIFKKMFWEHFMWQIYYLASNLSEAGFKRNAPYKGGKKTWDRMSF